MGNTCFEGQTDSKLIATEGFGKELEALINKHSMENSSDTPDFLLAEYLVGCLNVFNAVVKQRERWWSQGDPEEAK